MDIEIRLLKILEKVPQELREPLAEFFSLIDKELGERLTKKDFEAFEKRFEAFAERTEENFRRVWQAINELAEAQKKTEERLNELAEAQKKTEKRMSLLEQRMAELAEAQKKTEERLNELAEAQKKTEERLNELAEAQKKTEERLNELAEAQKKTEKRMSLLEQRMAELAEAQKKTEEVLRGALKRLDRLEERVEGLSDTVGYTLENRAYKALPGILSKYGLKVEDRLIRRYVSIRGKERQLNIYGYARRDSERVLILGEAKVRPSKKEISRFEKLCKALAEKEGLPVFKIFVAHDFPPSIEEELRKRDILPIWSYDLE